MRYQISGKQIDIGEALQTYVKDTLGAAVAKYAERQLQVVFKKVAVVMAESNTSLASAPLPKAVIQKSTQLSINAAKKWKSSCAVTNAG